MTPEELQREAQAALAAGTGLVLTLPRRTRGQRIRLSPWGGPLGEVLQEREDGSTVARFDPAAVLRLFKKEER